MCDGMAGVFGCDDRERCRSELEAQDAIAPEDFNRDVEFKQLVVAAVEMRQVCGCG